MTQQRYTNGTQAIERWDQVFDALSAEPRRQLIVSLLDRPPQQSVPLPESALSPTVPADPEALRRELRHVHLPKLAAMDLVDWKTEPFEATRGPRFREAAVVFDALHAFADDLPDSLVLGCRRLETERNEGR